MQDAINAEQGLNKGNSSLEPELKLKRKARFFLVAQVVMGLFLGLAAAEWMFSKRDDGAFPQVNFLR
ncbi:MAG: hypothetical protein GY822_17965 [Deltaproteobacteria bacterium]|nr:hypothetical protein [Deltaproteobacteria bacterium]